MNELTLFGKAMKYEQHGFGRNTEHWFAAICGLRIIIERMNPDDPFYAAIGESVTPGSPHATKELARDDAERTLRQLRDALTEAIGNG